MSAEQQKRGNEEKGRTSKALDEKNKKSFLVQCGEGDGGNINLL